MLQRTLPAGFIAPCLPTKTDKLPSGGQWLHEIKHDGFRIATSDPKVLQCAWKIETDANNGDFAWYPDMESMRYCFYVKPEVPPPRADRGAVSPG